MLYPATLLHQLFFHPPSLHLVIFFLVFLSILLFPSSYMLLFLEFSVHAQTNIMYLTLSVCAEYIYSVASHASCPDVVLILRDFHKVVKMSQIGGFYSLNDLRTQSVKLIVSVTVGVLTIA
jgi:hypothetical protein